MEGSGLTLNARRKALPPPSISITVVLYASIKVLARLPPSSLNQRRAERQEAVSNVKLISQPLNLRTFHKYGEAVKMEPDAPWGDTVLLFMQFC